MNPFILGIIPFLLKDKRGSLGRKKDPTQKLSVKLRRLRKKGLSWNQIYNKIIDDLAIDIELVFTSNVKARKTFEVIVSDFYTRPEFWSKLFQVGLDTFDLNKNIGFVSQRQLNPVIASQFSDITQEEIMARYLGHRLPSTQRNISIFQNLQGDVGLDAIARFYREYFFREADLQEVLIFWHFILNSVIRDLMEQTTKQKVEQALRKRNETMRILPDLTQPLAQMYKDATANWVFSLPIKVGDEKRNVVVVGPTYIAKKVKMRRNIIFDKQQSIALSRSWVKNMIDQKTFSTFLTEKDEDGLYYIPADIDLFGKPTKEYMIRTIGIDDAFDFIQKHHVDISNPNPRGFMYAIGAYHDDVLNAILTLNTAQARAVGYEGQFHIAEVSRIVVPERYKGEGLSTLLLQWLIDNRKLFNRSQFEDANVVTYSLISQPATIYKRVKTMYPTRLVEPAPDDSGRTNVVAKEFKIRWESTPAPKTLIRTWLPLLHPFYMKVFLGSDAWTGKPISKSVTVHDFRYFKTIPALSDVMKLLQINKTTWRSNTGKSWFWYKKNDKPKELIRALVFFVNTQTLKKDMVRSELTSLLFTQRPQIGKAYPINIQSIRRTK